MNISDSYVVFTLDDLKFGLGLSCIERILRIVEITPLPRAPEIVTGVINIQGQIVPVYNIRRRFNLPERETNLNDQLIVANTSDHKVAIVADSVSGIVECTRQEMVHAKDVLQGTDYVEGIIKQADGLIIIHDLDKFLSHRERKKLVTAIKGHKKG
ncbi:MAG: chemotaxis protein CheW [Dehalococcoidia bacterium]